MPEERREQDTQNLSPVDPALPQVTEINHRQKAAIIVSLLLQNGADMPLSRLPSDLQTDLTHHMAQLRLVDQKTLKLLLKSSLVNLMLLG